MVRDGPEAPRKETAARGGRTSAGEATQRGSDHRDHRERNVRMCGFDFIDHTPDLSVTESKTDETADGFGRMVRLGVSDAPVGLALEKVRSLERALGLALEKVRSFERALGLALEKVRSFERALGLALEKGGRFAHRWCARLQRFSFFSEARHNDVRLALAKVARPWRRREVAFRR